MTTFEIFKKTLIYFKPFKWVFLIIILLSTTENILYTFSTYFLGKFVDAISNNLENAYFLLVFYLLFLIFPLIIFRLLDFFSIKNTHYSLYHYVSRLGVKNTLNLSLGQLRREHSGSKQEILRSGNFAMDNYIIFLFMNLFH